MSAANLPDNVRAVIAKAMGYNDESSLRYWGTGGASKRFDDTVAALAEVWPPPLKPTADTIGPGKAPKGGAERACHDSLTELRVDKTPIGFALSVIFGRGESTRGAAIGFAPGEAPEETAARFIAIARTLHKEVAL